VAPLKAPFNSPSMQHPVNNNQNTHALLSVPMISWSNIGDPRLYSAAWKIAPEAEFQSRTGFSCSRSLVLRFQDTVLIISWIYGLDLGRFGESHAHSPPYTHEGDLHECPSQNFPESSLQSHLPVFNIAASQNKIK